MNDTIAFERRIARGVAGRVTAACACWFGMLLAPAALAYVGPGAGLGMVMAFFAMVLAVLATIVGLVLWPLRYLARRRKEAAGTATPPDADRPSNPSQKKS